LHAEIHKSSLDKDSYRFYVSLAIRLLRKNFAHAKQEHWAQLLGVDRSNYSKMELGKRHFEYEHLEIIAREMNMEPDLIAVMAGNLMRQQKVFGRQELSIKLALLLEAKLMKVEVSEDEIDLVLKTVEKIYFGKRILP
jgi:transcriptional regulator with XRE-family HTH domain